MNDTVRPYYNYDYFSQSITIDTHGLSPFIGVCYRKTFKKNISSSIGINNIVDEFNEVQGISVLLPRQKIEYDITNKKNILSTARISTLYVCEHLAWNNRLLNEQQTIELLETTEYIQKSREISGEQTLYRYSSIPFFIVPFTIGYTYGISIDQINILEKDWNKNIIDGGDIILVKVSSVNMEMFYNFINECSIDFRCSIRNAISHIQHLVDKHIYQIYMLVLNKTIVLSTYIFGPSWTTCVIKDTPNEFTKRPARRMRSQRERIEKVREHIANTSTALVKYLPPADKPKYDISGKRIHTKSIEHAEMSDRILADIPNYTRTIPKLISSIQNYNCELNLFLYGFFKSIRDLTDSLNISTQSNNNIMVIDTIAHNYRIIDEINRHFPPLWIDKWYYVMYNANIHKELSCKDLFMV